MGQLGLRPIAFSPGSESHDAAALRGLGTGLSHFSISLGRYAFTGDAIEPPLKHHDIAVIVGIEKRLSRQFVRSALIPIAIGMRIAAHPTQQIPAGVIHAPGSHPGVFDGAKRTLGQG